jgi:hypothetical protein
MDGKISEQRVYCWPIEIHADLQNVYGKDA